MKYASSFPNQFRQKLSRSLRRAGVIRGVFVLLAISGGVDSVTLLDSLLSVREEIGFRLAAVHVEHGIRGETSLRDACFTETLCRMYGVPCRVFSTDVPALAAKKHLSAEDAARKARYAILKEEKERLGADCIVTAHHGNDQAETMLMGFLRGSVSLLGGMRPVTEDARGRIVRPLLGFSRSEIERYAAERHLLHAEDETNADGVYLRNRIRSAVLPELLTENPALIRTAGSMGEELRELSDLAHQEAKRAEKDLVRRDGETVFLDERLQTVHPALLRIILRENVPGSREAVRELFSRQTGRFVRLDAQHIAYRVAGGIRIVRECEAAAEVPLNLPGVTETPWGTFTAGEPVLVTDPKTDGGMQWIGEAYAKRLTVRTPRPGEKMRPMGMGGTKLLSDLFTDAGIDRAQRAAYPVVAMGEEILWIPGVRPGESLRLCPGDTAYPVKFEAK